MTDNTKLCMNCMAELTGEEVCPQCGWNAQEGQLLHGLPYGTILQERYIVGRAKKTNGEGITYIGCDTVQNTIVEIREFFPQSFCQRCMDGKTVQVTGGSELVFKESLELFLNYARELAHMRELSAIVPIFDIFEENETAYTISEWSESITLRYFVERSGGSLSWNSARQLFMPVLSALSTMHKSGVCHLGISPDSLKIMQDGKMRLGDFYIQPVRRMDTDLPPDIVAGCAAIEQYVMDRPLNEATDVYGFAATLFFALTGVLPHDAVYRKNDSRLMMSNELAKALPPHVITALANALQVEQERRTQNFETLRAELSAAPTVTSTLEQTESITKLPPLPSKKEQGVPGIVWMLVSCAITLLVMSAIVWVWLQFQTPDFLLPDAGDTSAISSDTESVGTDSFTASSSEDSTQVEMIQAPNLEDQVYAELLKKVSASENPEYTVRLSERAFSTSVEEGKVISQEPKAGEMMMKGSSIVVVVSQGPSTRKLPSVAGLTLAEAAEKVTAEGFVPVTEKKDSTDIEAGRVIGYKNAFAGESLSYGSQVTLLISSGSTIKVEEE